MTDDDALAAKHIGGDVQRPIEPAAALAQEYR